MRLQKQLSRKVGDKEYPKYVIVLPPKIVNKAGWKEGQEILVVTKKDTIVLKKK